jgi:imidazolonepropionase-like amidohydrolase
VGARRLFDTEPELRNDPRFKLYPAWIQAQVTQPPPAQLAAFNALTDPAGGSGKMVLDIMRAGGLVVSGTDTPNAINLHGELMSYVLAGMSTFDALKAATVNPAKALNVETGTIEPGKLADIILVEGDPLADIAAAHHVKRVVANGRAYEMSDLLKGATATRTTTAQ